MKDASAFHFPDEIEKVAVAYVCVGVGVGVGACVCAQHFWQLNF